MRLRKRVLIEDGHWMLNNLRTSVYYAIKTIEDGTDDVIYESTDVWMCTPFGSRREEAEKHYEETGWKLIRAE